VLKTASRFAGAGELKKRRVETRIRRYEQQARVVKSDVKEFHMKKILTQYGVCAVAVALMVPLAQPAGMQAAFGKDAGELSDKFTGLARVMSGKYDWKPGQGVRSVGDVFNWIVEENGILVGALSGTPNTEAKPGEIAGSSEGFLRQSAKSDYGTFRQRPAGAGETVRKRHDEAGRADADSRRSTRASGAVDRVRAQQRRGSALV
jgi:hypothetical protein